MIGMKDLDEIIHILKRVEPELRSRFYVRKIGIFGSLVRKEGTDSIDVDILVELEKPIGLDMIELIYYLEDRLGVKVDLVTTKSLRPEFEESILKEVVYT